TERRRRRGWGWACGGSRVVEGEQRGGAAEQKRTNEEPVPAAPYVRSDRHVFLPSGRRLPVFHCNDRQPPFNDLIGRANAVVPAQATNLRQRAYCCAEFGEPAPR